MDYFKIDGSYGSCQDWFTDPMMRTGGCAAITACDSCIYFDLYRGTSLYPFDKEYLTRKRFVQFGMRMKPYLRPRWSGIDTLELYMDGFGAYLSGHGCCGLAMEPLYGTQRVSEAKKAIIRQIDTGLPIPCLLLNHRSPSMKFYEWHWFLLTGYERFEGVFMVKAVTYGSWRWLDLDELWNTGYKRKGGLILYRSSN